MATVPVPPGQYPPLFTITPTDQAGTIVIVTSICLVVAAISILLRVYVLVQLGGARVNFDDGAILIALIFAIVQTSLVLREGHVGLGRTIQDITNQQLEHIQQLQFADQIFYILTVWTSKVSVGLFLYRLTPRRSDNRTTIGLIGIVGITGLAAIFIVSLVCNVSRPWQYFDSSGVTCSAPVSIYTSTRNGFANCLQYGRWIAVAAMDIVSELLLAAMAVRIVWSIQLRSTKKIAVAFAFLQRLSIVAPIIARLHYLSVVFHSADPTLRATFSTICTEVHVAFAIAAACVPGLRPFLIATATHYGAPAEGVKSSHGQYADTAQSHSSRRNHGPGSFNMKRLRSAKTKDMSSQSSSMRDRSAHLSFSYKGQSNVMGGNPRAADGDSVKSDARRGMIIRRDVNYDVQYIDREPSRQSRRDEESR